MRSVATMVAMLVTIGGVCGSASADSQWVAGAAHLPGAAGTVWRTDLGVLNPCDSDVTVTLRLHTTSGVTSGEFVIHAGQQQLFQDVVAQLAPGNLKGALEVESGATVMVTARTYNLATSGTYGQSFAATTTETMFGPGDVVALQPLRENQDFRTNIGVLNAGDTAAALNLDLYDRHGTAIGTILVAVPAGGTVQLDRPLWERFGRADVVAGYARVRVIRGARIHPYASVVDNRTGDPTTIEPVPATSCGFGIAEQLAAIEGMTATEVPSGLAGYRRFLISYLQPADHAHPEGEQFVQRISLLHRSFEAPVVLNTQGYDLWVGRAEPTIVLDCNQIQVEHRFFGGSIPASGDWTLLTIEQAAADHHRIVEALKPIYSGAWLNTGYSKGGMTATYHRRFYPDDVTATVAYVAPLSLGAPDARYLDFLASVGTPACNQALWAIQRETLNRRDAMLDRLRARTDVSYDRIGGVERGFESIVVEIPFTFWQYTGETACSRIPATTASDDDIFDFVDDVVGWDYAGDAVWDYFEAYYYQAQSELGYPALARDHIADLLVTDAPDPEVGLPPAGTSPVFVPAAMPDIATWVATEGERLMFVYGQYDPWTGGAYELGGATDSYVYVVPGGTHGASIAALGAADRQAAVASLAAWTGVIPSKQLPATIDDSHPPWRRELRRIGGVAD